VTTVFHSTHSLAAALKRAAEAHHEYEQTTGKPDPNWQQWYAEYMAREQRSTNARRSDIPAVVWD
jgi:hypothetical protein